MQLQQTHKVLTIFELRKNKTRLTKNNIRHIKNYRFLSWIQSFKRDEKKR